MTKCQHCGDSLESHCTAVVLLHLTHLVNPTIEELEKILEQEGTETESLPSGEVLCRKDVLIQCPIVSCADCLTLLQKSIDKTILDWEKEN